MTVAAKKTKARIVRETPATDDVLTMINQTMHWLERDFHVQAYINCLRLKMKVTGQSEMKWVEYLPRPTQAK